MANHGEAAGRCGQACLARPNEATLHRVHKLSILRQTRTNLGLARAVVVPGAALVSGCRGHLHKPLTVPGGLHASQSDVKT